MAGRSSRKLLGHAQKSAARSRIARNLSRPWAQLAADELQAWLRCKRHDGHPGERRIDGGGALHEALHDPILERMETDDGEPAAGCKYAQCSIQTARERTQFIVDEDAQRLKSASCGVLARLTRAHRACRERRKLTGAQHR